MYRLRSAILNKKHFLNSIHGQFPEEDVQFFELQLFQWYTETYYVKSRLQTHAFLSILILITDSESNHFLPTFHLLPLVYRRQDTS